MKSTVVDESLSSFKPMYCSREYQTSTRLNQQYEKSTLNIGKCSLFVHPSHTCPRLAWTPPVSIVELLLCQPGVSSPCDNWTWNGKGKDCYCLEQDHAVGINCDFSKPTKYIQHLPVTILSSLGGPKVHSSRGLVWQPCAVAPHDHSLNCSSSGLIRLMSTYSQVRSVLLACEEVHWWWLNGSLTHCELDMASTSPFISSFSFLSLCA